MLLVTELATDTFVLVIIPEEFILPSVNIVSSYTITVHPIFTPVLAVTIPIESSFVTSSSGKVPLSPRLPFTVRFGTGFGTL